MRGVLMAVALMLGSAAAWAQADSLTDAAEQARQAWLAHDATTLVGKSPQLVVQLPGTDPSAPLDRAQAVALLTDFLSTAREVEVAIRAAREVEPGRGYVELIRRYQVAGTQDIRVQSLLLGYRRGKEGWGLVELRVVG